MRRKLVNTKTVALGGVMLALLLMTLFLASFLPGVELTLYAISSVFTAIIILETNIKGGTLFYFASALMALALIPNKLAILPYLFLFGFYGILKYLIEKIAKLPIEIILKLLIFNISLGTGLFIFKEAFVANIRLPEYSNFILIIAGQFMFLLYDYIFSLIIGFYSRRFKGFR